MDALLPAGLRMRIDRRYYSFRHHPFSLPHNNYCDKRFKKAIFTLNTHSFQHLSLDPLKKRLVGVDT